MHHVLRVVPAYGASTRVVRQDLEAVDPLQSRAPHFEAGGIEIILGDAFGLDAEILADCDAVYDRAAVIALPPELRARYVGELYARLPQGCRGLLITLEYPQDEKQGPPFSVTEAEVMERFGRDWEVEVLERRDILAQQPGFQAEGVSALETVVYRMERG